jgi:hypothetical protein
VEKDKVVVGLTPCGRPKLTYAMEQRMRFIDFQIFHYGHITRRHLIDFFGVTSATATRDFALFIELYPNQIKLHTLTKLYVPTKQYSRIFP